MANPNISYCGIDCEVCAIQTGCPGCRKAAGKLFWGDCALARCCMEKQHEHCGQCREFPCDMLKEYAYDPEHGDNGARIRNLEALNAGQPS